MYILMLNNEYPPLGGGTATVNAELVKKFAGNRIVSLQLITSATGTSTTEEMIGDNIKICRLPVGIRNIHHATIINLSLYLLKAYWLAKQLIKKRKPDILFAWCSVPAGYLAYILKKQFKIPYIVRISGPDIPGFEQRYRYFYPLLIPLLKVVWKNADKVVVKCQSEQEMINSILPDLKMNIIPNGVDISSFIPSTSRVQSPIPKVLCVGRLIERKGQQFLLEAVKLLQAKGIFISVTLVGEGDWEQKYRALVEKLNLQEWVHFAGYIPREQMPQIYLEHDIFVLPSDNEGMSIALLEATASGLKIVATDTGGTAEILKDRKAARIVERMSSKIAEGVEEVIDLPFDEITAETLNYLSDWSKIADRYFQLIKLQIQSE